jgi:hypothetical protein
MKWKDLAKRSLLIALTAYVMNNMNIPTHLKMEEMRGDDKKMVFHSRLNTLLEDTPRFGGAQDEKVLLYLAYSQLSAVKHMEIVGYYPKNKLDLDSVLESREADCQVISNMTYGNFLRLLHASGDTSLKDHVKLAKGYIQNPYNKKKWHTHQWIEMLYKDRWTPFEAMDFDIPTDSSIMDTLQAINPIGVYLKDRESYIPLAYIQSESPGELSTNFQMRTILTDTKGTSLLFRNMLFY